MMASTSSDLFHGDQALRNEFLNKTVPDTLSETEDETDFKDELLLYCRNNKLKPDLKKGREGRLYKFTASLGDKTETVLDEKLLIAKNQACKRLLEKLKSVETDSNEDLFALTDDETDSQDSGEVLDGNLESEVHEAKKCKASNTKHLMKTLFDSDSSIPEDIESSSFMRSPKSPIISNKKSFRKERSISEEVCEIYSHNSPNNSSKLLHDTFNEHSSNTSTKKRLFNAFDEEKASDYQTKSMSFESKATALQQEYSLSSPKTI